MNFISRDTDYAWRALMFIADNGEKGVVTVDEIVQEEGLPERFLRRILQRLAKKRILVSHKGKKGGFSFAKSPEKISLVDIIKVFQGNIDFTNCLLKGRVCPNIKKCALRRKLQDIAKIVDKELRGITIVSLLKEP